MFLNIFCGCATECLVSFEGMFNTCIFFCFEGMFLNIFSGCATECLSQQLLSVFLISFEGMIESWSQQCPGSWVLGHPYNLGLSRGWAPDCRQFAVVTHIILSAGLYEGMFLNLCLSNVLSRVLGLGSPISAGDGRQSAARLPPVCCGHPYNLVGSAIESWSQQCLDLLVHMKVCFSIFVSAMC